MKKDDFSKLPAESLRAMIKETESAVRASQSRLANQERKLTDLKMALLDRLENGS